jgi:serine/threonine-protein kinase
MSLHVGEAVGDYRVTGIVGFGGMGQVFQVEHKITKRKEAMKILLADLAEETQVQRFKREIEVQARLNHPNIAAVHNAFRLKDRLILVLEFVEGRTLESLLKQSGLPWKTAIDYARQTLNALSYAHENGVIHRDVSPANLMVTESGLVKLMDFGVAKSLGDLRLTDGGSMIGSLYYMAPEQVKGASEPDARADVYSAGVILYEMVTGRRPFEYEDRFSLMVAQVEELPRPPREIEPELPDGLEEIILTALAKDPAQRYQSARGFLQALDRLTQPVPLPGPSPAEPPRRSRFVTVAAGAGALLIGGTAGAAALAWNRFEEPPRPKAAISTPPVPLALMTIPAAPAAVESAPEPVDAAPKVVAPQKAITRAVTRKTAPKVMAMQPVEEEPVVIQPVEAAPPEQPEAEPAPPVEPFQPVVAQEPPATPVEPKKAHFWSRLNPFRSKPNPFKKKNASALRRPGDVPADPQK